MSSMIEPEQQQQEQEKQESREGALSTMEEYDPEKDFNLLPRESDLYNTNEIIQKLENYPTLSIRSAGKYYLNTKETLTESNRKMRKDPRTGRVILNLREERLGPVEYVVKQFCERVLTISRSTFLPLSSQGERHIIWVGKKKANHIIRRLNGNGCYVVNRFPGDIFLKDKQVMGVTLKHHMLARSNECRLNCGKMKEGEKEVKTAMSDLTYKMCQHMVNSMVLKCDADDCDLKAKTCCAHLDIFIPEIQSFCTYNALQNFFNRMSNDLKGQTFVCKPAYLYKGNGFRFFHEPIEFKEFYHMTEGKETSRHDFMVQRLITEPRLHKVTYEDQTDEYKFDIRAFLLVIVLRYRRVVSFVHFGFCRRAEKPFSSKPTCCIGTGVHEKEVMDRLQQHQETIICTFQSEETKQRRKTLLANRQESTGSEDRSMFLEDVFAKEATEASTVSELESVQEQIKHIGQQVTKAIENKVWDWFGCFQLFSMDLCVQKDNNKVWLIEINSHALSEVDTLSSTQRRIVPAILSEAIGLVAECQYKSFHNMRLRCAPEDEFDVTGFLFKQNYEFIYSTPRHMRMDYKPPKPQKGRQMPYYLRIDVVDQQIRATKERKDLQERKKREVLGKQAKRKGMKNMKTADES